MGDHNFIHTASRRSLAEEAGGLDVATGPRLAAMVAVLGLSLVLVAAPVIVALLAMEESTLTQAAQSWLAGASGWLAAFAHASVFLFLPMAGMVASTKEDV